MTAIVGLRGLTLDPGGNTVWAKDPDTVQAPASMTKVVTAYTARRWLALSGQISVISADLVGGSTANLLAGDVLTFEDALYGMMLPSGNDAATAVARTAGDAIRTALGGATGGLARFLQQMTTTMTGLGWSGHVFDDVSGLSSLNRATMRQMCHLVRHVDATDPTLRTIMGTRLKTITITGVNARSIGLVHTIDPAGAVPLPEFVAGKTGSTASAGACAVVLWDAPGGGRYAAGVMNSNSTDRFLDVRALIDAGLTSTTRRATRLHTGGTRVAATTVRNDGTRAAARWGRG